MRRILHSITSLNVGGAQYMLARYLRHLETSEYLSTVLSLTTPGPVGKLIDKRGFDILSLRMADGRIGPTDMLRLARLVRAARADILHGWMYHGNLAATFGSMSCLSFAPVIWSIHHSLSDITAEKPLTQRLVRLSARLSSWTQAISYCSQTSADDHEKLGFDPRRRVIIPNGIDCEEFQPTNGAKQKLANLLGVPPERHIIGNVARAHPMKDHAGFVQAVAKLLQQGYDVQGLVIGEGHEDGMTRATARDLDIDARISTLGIRSDVADLVRGFDVFVLSSAWGEAFPLAVAEAMASGVPAAVTDVGDCSWLVGDTGKVVPTEDAPALASAIAALLTLSPEARKQLGERARNRVIENFSLEQYVARHEALYEAALGRPPPGGARPMPRDRTGTRAAS